MAKLSDLVSCLARVTGVPEGTVREISRRLRECELITTGKVGRYGGADMTASDAASLLAGLLVASSTAVSISELGSLTKSYLKFRSYSPSNRPPLSIGRWDRSLSLPLLCSLPKGHSFKEALSAIIQSAANGDIERRLGTFSCEIELGRARPFAEARIDITAWRLFYYKPADVKSYNLFTPANERKWRKVLSDADNSNLKVAASLTEDTVAAIGLLLTDQAGAA